MFATLFIVLFFVFIVASLLTFISVGLRPGNATVTQHLSTLWRIFIGDYEA
jgi:hypothetical protein